MEKYNLRGKEGKVEKLMDELQTSPSRMYDVNSVKYNFDNCECPSCPCADPDLPKILQVAGAGVLAASTPILVAATAAEATGK